MKIYHVSDDEGDGPYFSTKGGAIKEARLLANSNQMNYDVHECEVVAGKDGVVAMANQKDWCVASTKLQTFKPRKSSKDNDQ